MRAESLRIAGQKVAAPDGRVIEVRNPFTRELVGTVPKASLAQVRINWDVEAPVTGAPMAIVYAAGVVFAVPAALLLLSQLWRTLTGRLHDDELVMVKESEDLAHLNPAEADEPKRTRP